jgi:hypothetical protein
VDRIKLVEDLTREEPEAVIRTLAMMAYNPAIARVLERNGVRKFESLMVEVVPRLSGIATQTEFDIFHAEICERIILTFRTNKDVGLSWGQAQKPINVFLKVYVAWAKLPELATAEGLRPFLHVPLDSVLMGFIKERFPQEYRQHMQEVCAKFVSDAAAQHPNLAQDRTTRWLVDNVELSLMPRPVYVAWQEFLRFIHPDRPILLDTIWATQRNLVAGA